MTAAAHTKIKTSDPQRTALLVMGDSARRASNTWTLRQWAGDLAASAPPKDYVGQLRALYDGILKRWRYVQEPDEWVPGPRGVINNVLGARRNQGPTCPSPDRCDVARTPWKLRGWGDCDDVSTLTAAGVLALGMTPYFRVATSPGGAHVSVTARTPTGALVEVDPVGHPEHPFGWAVTGPAVRVYHVDMRGGPAFSNYQFGQVPVMVGPRLEPVGVPTYEPQFGYLRGWHPVTMGDLEAANDPTYCLDTGTQENFEIPGQMAFVHPKDHRGPRYLSMASSDLQWAKRGFMLTGTPAVDQFGQGWQYSADHDAWAPDDVNMGRVGFFRRIGRAFRRIGKGIKRVVRAVGKGVRRVGKAIRRVVGTVLGSRLAQWIAGIFSRVIGIPAQVTRRLMAAAGSFLKEGGLIKLFRLVKRNPKEALKMLSRAGAAALRPIRGVDEPLIYEIEQGGGRAHVAPIGAIFGVPHVRHMGALNTTETEVPGNYYNVHANDSLLKIAGKAYGVGAGAERIARAKWIANAMANRPQRIASKSEFNKKYFPDGVLNLQPGVAIWIPPAEGIEPPPEPAPVPPGPDPDPPTPEPDEPKPGPVPIPPPEPMPGPINCSPGYYVKDGHCVPIPKPGPGPTPGPNPGNGNGFMSVLPLILTLL